MILIISDYHKEEEKVLSLIKTITPDTVLCLGDGESKEEFYLENNIISVKGNCDYANLPLVKVFEDNGISIEHMPSGIDTMTVFVHQSDNQMKSPRLSNPSS